MLAIAMGQIFFPWDTVKQADLSIFEPADWQTSNTGGGLAILVVDWISQEN